MKAAGGELAAMIRMPSLSHIRPNWGAALVRRNVLLRWRCERLHSSREPLLSRGGKKKTRQQRYSRSKKHPDHRVFQHPQAITLKIPSKTNK
jgi:hypothetical protein